MSLSLPYQFDTSYIGKIIVKTTVYLESVLLLGLLYRLFLFNVPSVLGILFLMVFIGGFGITIFRKDAGATGTVTSRDVVVDPVVLCGIPSKSSRGQFLLTCFKSVRVEWRSRVSRGVQLTSGINEQIYLAGKEGTPDIEIARFTDGSGRRFAQELGALLSLPCEEKAAPGVHGTRPQTLR